MESKGIPIALIHYTDTHVEFGARKDRHCRIGTGKIGMRSLLDILLWANMKQVPCVLE
jgi:endonuclease IV